jgi:hypothetical protein
VTDDSVTPRTAQAIAISRTLAALRDPGCAGPQIDTEFATRRRLRLERDSWLDHVPGWLGASDALLGEVVRTSRWRESTHHRHRGRRVAACIVSEAAVEGAMPVVREMAFELSDRYRVEFERVELTLYHSHRDGTQHVPLPVLGRRSIVPILRLGATRQVDFRSPAGSQSSLGMAGGDLVVLRTRGDARAWTHGVHPQELAAGPSMAVLFVARHRQRSPTRVETSDPRDRETDQQV